MKATQVFQCTSLWLEPEGIPSKKMFVWDLGSCGGRQGCTVVRVALKHMVLVVSSRQAVSP